MKLRRRLAATVMTLTFAASGAHGQLSQFTAPGELARVQVPAREQIRERIAKAPWKLGNLRIQPAFSIGNFEYVANIFASTDESGSSSELRGSVTAGLDAYLPVGAGLVLSTFVRPGYSWWKNNAELRHFNRSYGAAMFGLYNRLSTQLSTTRVETEKRISNEVRIPTTTRQDRVGFDAEVTLRGPWQLFGSIGHAETRYPEATDLADQVPNLSFLARDEEDLSLGLSYDVPGRFNLGVGWRRTDSQFLDDPEGRSNSGDAPFIRISVQGNRLQIDGDIGIRRLEFDSASGLQESEETTGRLRIGVPIGHRTGFALYGGRSIAYSVTDAGSFFVSDRSGAALTWGREGPVQVGFFFEMGTDDFESSGGVNLGRVDEGESYGVRFTFPLRWGLRLDLGFLETEIDSNLDMFDRSYSGITSAVRLKLTDIPF